MAILALAPNSPHKGIVSFSQRPHIRPIKWLVLDNSLSGDEIKQGDTIYFSPAFNKINENNIYLIYLKSIKDWIVAKLVQVSQELFVLRWSNPKYPAALIETKDIEIQGELTDRYLYPVKKPSIIPLWRLKSR